LLLAQWALEEEASFSSLPFLFTLSLSFILVLTPSGMFAFYTEFRILSLFLLSGIQRYGFDKTFFLSLRFSTEPLQGDIPSGV